MGDSNQTPEKPASGRKPLSLKGVKVAGGTVRQNISHGRSKAVVVEKRRKRIVAPKDGSAKPAPEEKPVEVVEEVVVKAPPPVETTDAAGHTLTPSEQAARAAMRSMQGEFSAVIHSLVEDLTKLRIYVESALDFPEEEIDF